MTFSELKIALGFASDPTLASFQHSAPGVLPPSVPIRGWLALLASSEIVVGLYFLIEVAQLNVHMWNIWHILSRQSYWLLVCVRVLGALAGGLCIYAGIAVWGKWKDSVQHARLAMTSVLVYVVISFLVRPLIIVLSLRRPNDAYSVLANIHTRYVYEVTYCEALTRYRQWSYIVLLLEMSWCVACLVYFRTSHRVQSTYGNNQMGEEQQVST